MSGDGPFPALGDRFVAFRRVLASKSLPPIDTLFEFWDEIRASGFDWLMLQQFGRNKPSFSPEYATYRLIEGIAHDRTRKDAKTPDIDTAVRLLNGRWQIVRDELVKFAAVLVEKLEQVKAAEERLHRVDVPPSKPETEPALSLRQYEILEALLQKKATDPERRLSTDEIAEAVEGRSANPESFKHPIADLKRLGFVGTKRGRSGGCWLTDDGRALVERRKNA